MMMLRRRRIRGEFRIPNPQRLVRCNMSTRMPKQIDHMTDLIGLNDVDCINNLRMNHSTFNHLCYLLRHSGGLVESKYVSVEEQVALFLNVLAHHTRVRVVSLSFKRSGQTISKHFHTVLKAVLKLHGILLATPTPIDDDENHPRCKHFKGCLGALDGTYIDVTVPESVSWSKS